MTLFISPLPPIKHQNLHMKLINILNSKIGYLPFPKVACTSIKRTLYRIDNGKEFSPEEEECHIHRYYNSPKYQHYQEQGQSASDFDFDFSFVVIREPIKRFLSAYSNRVCHHKELSKDTLAKRHPNLLKDIPCFTPRIGQYIDNFRSYLKVHSINHHAKPISTELNKYQLLQFSKIYPIEKISMLEGDLSQVPKMDVSFGQYQTGGRKIDLRDLSESHIQFLTKFYKEDYALLEDYYSPSAIWTEWAGHE